MAWLRSISVYVRNLRYRVRTTYLDALQNSEIYPVPGVHFSNADAPVVAAAGLATPEFPAEALVVDMFSFETLALMGVILMGVNEVVMMGESSSHICILEPRCLGPDLRFEGYMKASACELRNPRYLHKWAYPQYHRLRCKPEMR